jgi:hypothetical protein
VAYDPPASHRNAANPAGQALTKIVSLLASVGYGFTIPAWNGDACLRINNALRAIADLTLTSRGNVTWEYRSPDCPHLHLSRLVGVAIKIRGCYRDRHWHLAYPHRDYPSPALPRHNRDLRRRRTRMAHHASHHPDGGIPLPNIAATIFRALA